MPQRVGTRVSSFTSPNGGGGEGTKRWRSFVILDRAWAGAVDFSNWDEALAKVLRFNNQKYCGKGGTRGARYQSQQINSPLVLCAEFFTRRLSQDFVACMRCHSFVHGDEGGCSDANPRERQWGTGWWNDLSQSGWTDAPTEFRTSRSWVLWEDSPEIMEMESASTSSSCNHLPD